MKTSFENFDIRKERLIFYDGTCGMCHNVVNFVLKQDKKKLFRFAPLQGETAKKLLKEIPQETLVLLDNHYPLIRGKGMFRILWLLGGFWSIPGSLFFLPPLLYDWAYRWVAKHRFQWFSSSDCLIPTDADRNRFLP